MIMQSAIGRSRVPDSECPARIGKTKRTLQSVSAIVGFALLFCGSAFVDCQTWEESVENASGNWLSRKAHRKGLTAVLTGNLVAQILSLGVVLRTMALGDLSTVALGIVIHVVLGSLFTFFLFRKKDA